MRSNQSILKETSPGCWLEGLMLKLKLQYLGHLMQRADSFEKTLMLGKIEEEKGTTEDEMAGWHHWLNGHGFEWTPGVGDGQAGLACCNPWGHKELDTTERLNWTELMVFLVVMYGYESWAIKKVECWRIYAFEFWCWRILLGIPWAARRSNQSILRELNHEYSVEKLMLKLKLQYFGHLMWKTDSLEETLMLGKIEGKRKRGQQRIRW